MAHRTDGNAFVTDNTADSLIWIYFQVLKERGMSTEEAMAITSRVEGLINAVIAGKMLEVVDGKVTIKEHTEETRAKLGKFARETEVNDVLEIG